MKLAQICKIGSSVEQIPVNEAKSTFTKITSEDYDKWVELLTDMVESEGVDFAEAIDVLDQDPKFEALSPAEQKQVLKKISKLYYESIH